MFAKRIPLSATANTRDLGGYPTADGNMTRFGRILRSDVPKTLTQEDRALLLGLGVTTAIDLRSPEEVQRTPSMLSQAPPIAYISIPFAIGSRIAVTSEEMYELYVDILEDTPAMARVMRTVLGAPGGVIYHCAAGKDRTGVVSAVLLLLAGVGLSDVLADYQVSYTYIREKMRRILREHPEVSPFCASSEIELMEAVIERLEKGYGDVRGYLAAMGLSGAEAEALRMKLL